MKLSVIIPAHNEEGNISRTVKELYDHLVENNIPHELVVVNDNSKDRTFTELRDLQKDIETLVVVNNLPPNGFGFAIRKGLDSYSGDAVAIYMADRSDLPQDLVKFYQTMKAENVDCVFGSRFISGATVVDYPKFKYILNRMANFWIRIFFGIRYNDVTNAFKLYRRNAIDGVQPLLSHHFNITVELPLKAIVRGYSYKVVPNSWYNREQGTSNFKVKEMGSRYMFIIFYCLIEKWLSMGDYHRSRTAEIEQLRTDSERS